MYIIINYQPKPDVRLKAGARFGEGRVEVFHDGHWGTICGDDFDKVSASIVCRQLGFGTAMEVMGDASGYGQGEMLIPGTPPPKKKRNARFSLL